MLSSAVFLLICAGVTGAAPVTRRQVTELDPAATAEANPFDDTATRAFTATPIVTSGGQCLTIDPLGGDFRQNLIPITTAACDGSDAQQWDILTSGKHNDQAGFINVVSTLTNGCLNFDPRRAAGNQVVLFSCGGRADGGGLVTDSQLFPFEGGNSPLTLAPKNGNNAICLTAVDGRIDQTACDTTNPSETELFTFGATGTSNTGENNSASATGNSTTADAPPVLTSATSATDSTAATQTASAPAGTGTAVLDPAAVKEAQQRDDTATRAFSDIPIKTVDGKCLKVDSLSGDFRENLIPVTVEECDGSAGQNWDIISAGEHNNVDGTMLVVSTLTQGCLNLDLRRQAGNQAILFSCGGRADGEGLVTQDQLFKFGGQATNAFESASTGNNSGKCLVDNGGKLDVTDCTGDGSQVFTFGA